MFVLWLALLFAMSLVSICSQETIVIDTKLGQIKGKVHNKTKQQIVYSFYGIQYGTVPLRFAPAQLNESKWNGIYDGTRFGDVCMQVIILDVMPPQQMSEDCLFLNIYTQKPSNTGTLLPVMFFIHGGGFMTGAGSDSTYYGVNIVGKGKDFVYVSINYRLGPFGFLSNEQLFKENANWKSYGGLNGLYDQIQALNWVKKYISDYGGNPNQITIFGESAGGLSVCMLLISPLAKGLFSRAIIESGACNGPWGTANTSDGLAFSNKRLQNAGYPIDNLTYLRDIPAEEFQFKVASLVWDTAVDDLILTQQPIITYSNLNKNTLNVDKLIVGFNTMDGIVGFPWHSGFRPSSDNEYQKFLNYYFNETQANLMYNYYYPPSDFSFYPPDHNSYELAWFTITCDVCLTCPSLMMGNEINKQIGTDIVYIYQFGGPGRNGSFYAPHGSELIFVFDDGARETNWFFEMPWDQRLSNVMISSWTNFGKYGIPNITDSNDNTNIKWDLYESTNNVIIFRDVVKMEQKFAENYRKNVCFGFWYDQIEIDTMNNICSDTVKPA
eukprot:200889_1